jgi:lauroyl/myristoyl acyltransferase
MYFLAKLVYKILHILPIGFCLFLGKLIGLSLYFNKKKRRVAFINIKQAFPQKTSREIFSTIKKGASQFGMNLIEAFLADRLKEGVELEFREKSKDSHIIVGIHEGSWELYNVHFASKFKFAIFVQEQKQQGLNRFLNELRAMNNLRVCSSLKEAITAIKENYWLGLVIDHGAEKNAPLVDFFGKSLPTPGGAVYLAKKFNKKIFPAFGYRLGSKHFLKIGEGIDPQTEDSTEILGRLNRIYEGYILQYPWEYLWWYKRFKRKKSRSILVLSDGKIGHLRQSQALLASLKKVSLRIEEKTVEVSYKNGFMRLLAEFFAYLCGKSCLGCAQCLRFILKKESWSVLSKNFSDIVISTGCGLAPINAIYSKTIGAKSCIILKPNVPLSKFDVTLIPEHDKIEAKNAVKIKGALTNYTDLAQMVEEGKIFFKLSPANKISLFLGNFLRDPNHYIKNLRLFLKELKDFSLKKDLKMLVTTSRRTSPFIERVIEEELRDFKSTESLVIVSRKNWPFVVPTFLSLSEIVFITSDSISMISESLTLGKTTVCVFLERLKGKHGKFLLSLKDEFVNFLDYPYNRFEFSKPLRSLEEENLPAIQEAIRRLL